MNKYTAQVPITISGKEYTLEYDWRAVSKLYSAFGEKALVGISRRSPDDVALFLHAGLCKHHPEVTLDFILDAGLPYIPTFDPIEAGIMYFYYGAGGVPEKADSTDESGNSKKN